MTAAPPQQSTPCPDCGNRHNPLAFCEAKQCTTCGQETPGGGLCSTCSYHPNRCAPGCCATTAAPGPQQPDEVQLEAHELRPGDVIVDAWTDPYDGETRLTVARPAAPSAQPDEVGARIHHAIPDDHPVWQQMLDQAAQPIFVPVADFVQRAIDRAPAQPVRDTEEGRR